MKTQTREMWDRCWDTAETDTQKKYDFLVFLGQSPTNKKKKKRIQSRFMHSSANPTYTFKDQICHVVTVVCFISNSPFLSPKKRVCCAGFDHWREVLSLNSTRQVRFAIPPSVTVTFWTRGYCPLIPAKRHKRETCKRRCGCIRWGTEKAAGADRVRQMAHLRLLNLYGCFGN